MSKILVDFEKFKNAIAYIKSIRDSELKDIEIKIRDEIHKFTDEEIKNYKFYGLKTDEIIKSKLRSMGHAID